MDRIAKLGGYALVFMFHVVFFAHSLCSCSLAAEAPDRCHPHHLFEFISDLCVSLLFNLCGLKPLNHHLSAHNNILISNVSFLFLNEPQIPFHHLKPSM